MNINTDDAEMKRNSQGLDTVHKKDGGPFNVTQNTKTHQTDDETQKDIEIVRVILCMF